MALGIVGMVILLGVGGSGYYAFRTYDYVQHDNDFCLSCHLMAEPYELFAESAHQGLGCKACHQPTLVGRSQMALTQILENPEEISVHADVPNEICADCHIEGDPEKWRSIENSVGHRVHFESEDPVLAGLQCVECHSTSLHEFAPIDRTCAQSGCHEDNIIRLGAMGDLTIHCAACHTFVAPVEEAELNPAANVLANEVDAAILPDFEECFSCHVMRTLVQMPEPDPHSGVCAACHNPHEQEEPSDAVESCATAGCHEGVDSLSAFHRGIEETVLSSCLNCHAAHDFGLDGSDCASCHAGADAPGVGSAFADFDHGQHPDVECASCHVSETAHAALTAESAEDCSSCHHTAPLSQTCARCHTPEEGPRETFTVVRPMVLDVGTNDPRRAMAFPHASHNEVDCASCHTEGTALSVTPDLDCQSCHEDHHGPEVDCASCHEVVPTEAHPPEEAHVTCSGAGCHERVPFESVPRTRAFCLGCHQDLGDHEPDRACAECHTLPAPRGGV
jgi:nitrate/TMAO reductase-like tetraheme cytochrome c subunit